MIHLITQKNKSLYSETLTKMFEQRTALFVDRLNWNLKTTDGKEIDEFDTDDTVYLVLMDESNLKIRSSIRLNPTTKPHLMSKLFSDLCQEGVPTGDEIVEGSRYCYNPDLMDIQDRRNAMRLMMCGVMECAMLYGWQQITFVINMPLLSHCLRCGWDIYPLGIPKYEDKMAIGAFAIDVTQEGLIAARANASLTEPSLVITPSHKYAA